MPAGNKLRETDKCKYSGKQNRKNENAITRVGYQKDYPATQPAYDCNNHPGQPGIFFMFGGYWEMFCLKVFLDQSFFYNFFF